MPWICAFTGHGGGPAAHPEHAGRIAGENGEPYYLCDPCLTKAIENHLLDMIVDGKARIAPSSDGQLAVDCVSRDVSRSGDTERNGAQLSDTEATT